MKKYTIKQVARAAKRDGSLIARLAQSGKIKGEKVGKAWLIEGESLPALAQKIKEMTPKGGWHKRVAPKMRRHKSTPANLEQVLAFMEFSDSKRALLLELGTKTTEENIALLMGLV